MNDFTGLYEIRDATPEDHNFVLATFLRGLYYGESAYSQMPKAIFMGNYQPVAQALLAKRQVKIACLKDDPGVILGYSILSHDYLTVDFVYVKSAWRRKGIARSLLPSHPLFITHLTKLGSQLMSKLNNVVFNPFALS